jgi:hypothetical protein
MNFIEQIFGIGPDAGDGSFEMLLFLVSIAGIVLITLYRRASSRRWLAARHGQAVAWLCSDHGSNISRARARREGRHAGPSFGSREEKEQKAYSRRYPRRMPGCARARPRTLRP